MKTQKKSDLWIQKPRDNGIWFISLFLILVVGIYVCVSDSWKEFFSDKTIATLYQNADHCQKRIGKTKQYLCKRSEDIAESMTGYIKWNYESNIDCEFDYGNQMCEQKDGKLWGPIRNGFALVEIDNVLQSIPTFYSLRNPGYYFAPGYPLALGSNMIPKITSEEQYLLTKARKLSSKICESNEKNCQTRAQIAVSGNKTKTNQLLSPSIIE